MFEDFNLEIELIHKNAKMPTRANFGDAGLDFYTPEDIKIKPRSDVLIPLGLKTRFPEGYVLIFKEKSGISVKKKLDIGACVIDSGYRNIVHAHLFNNSDEEVEFKTGDKVIQGLIMPVWAGLPIKVNKIEDITQRNQGGFGSTDIKK